MSSVFFNVAGGLRSGWWVLIFLLLMTALLFPLILVAQDHGVQVPIWQQGAVVLVASLICQLLRNGTAEELLGKFDVSWITNLIYGSVLGSLLMVIPAVTLFLTGSAAFTFSATGAVNLAPALLVFVSVAATEELMFRGFLFRRLTEGLGNWLGQGVVACFFLLVHLDALKEADGLPAFLGGLNIFAASFMFGLACLRTGGLAMPLGLHLFANLVQGSVLGFGVSGGDEQGLLEPHLTGPAWWTGGSFGLEASLPGLVCVLATCLFLWSLPRPKAPPG